QTLHGGGDRRPDLAGQRRQGLAGAGNQPEPDEDAVVMDADPDGRSGEQTAPGRSTTADADDPRHLEGGEPDELGDHRTTHGQLRPAHEASLAAAAEVARDSAMSAGTPVRAVVAATSQANVTIRRRA